MLAVFFWSRGNITYPVTIYLKVVEKNKVDAARFSPFWNEIIRNLREEDYITNLLVMETAIYFSYRFSPFFRLIWYLHGHVFLACSEMELLLMPKNSGDIPLVQWPLFLLASKVVIRFNLGCQIVIRSSYFESWMESPNCN